MKNIGFIDEVHPVLEEQLKQNGFNCIDLTQLSKSEIQNQLHKFEGLVIRSKFKLDVDFLKQGENLKFIARSGAGLENIDIDYCKRNNIALLNAPEGNRNAVGEHALGMLLTLFNKIIQGNNEIKSKIWNREVNRGVELDGKTVGIIGYGNNGSAFAKKLLGFDVEVLAYDKYKIGFSHQNVKEATLKELFEKCDILSLHIPQNDETMFMVDDTFLNQFKKSIYLINLSRGKIIKTSALVKALKTDKVLGACLDVLEYENSAFVNMFDTNQKLETDFEFLLSSEQVILTPHVGGWTTESYYKLSDVLFNKISKLYRL